MAPQKPLRDWLYLAMTAAQISGSLFLDLVPFYPRPLWHPPWSALHFLVTLRSAYTNFTKDPYFPPLSSPSIPAYPAAQAWFLAFLYIKAFVNLPLCLYLSRRLGTSKTSGPVEIASLVLACISAMGATTCCVDLWHMGPNKLSPSKKPLLIYGVYMPFAIIPAMMAVDMSLRLLARVQRVQEKSKRQ
ncbi:hypothetical protein CDD81_5648 [Ophiocordyceps australis]|uniref:EXPERA domain-containing protein n=1 Tax=Ophiocordyceps australis TaxID=1399860 RepID=A0A2C5Y4N7_9HYPO|nr:hypothetical protein CDD81_5648 [Ophiocordyceps australis]